MKRKRDPDIGCIDRSTNGLIPCMHRGKFHRYCEVWKPLGPLPSREHVEATVRQFVLAPLDGCHDFRPAIVDYICAAGDCVIHACAVLAGAADRCQCSSCRPDDPRRPWRDLDLRLAQEGAP